MAVTLTRVGAVVASLGVLLSLLAGVGRTAFSMAAEGDLPRWLSAVEVRRRVPQRAELVVAAVVVAIVAVADLRGAIGFSSFAVLAYYTVANASAWTLGRAERRAPRTVAVAGVLGCVVIAFSLPASSVLAGVVALLAGAVVWGVRERRDRRTAA
jgi:basic amino acid/polyamine antiporter, APA family